MPSTPQIQSFNRKSLTVFTKCDELARLDGTEVAVFIRRKNQISFYQSHEFWLSREDIVGLSEDESTSGTQIAALSEPGPIADPAQRVNCAESAYRPRNG